MLRIKPLTHSLTAYDTHRAKLIEHANDDVPAPSGQHTIDLRHLGARREHALGVARLRLPDALVTDERDRARLGGGEFVRELGVVAAVAVDPVQRGDRELFERLRILRSHADRASRGG